MERASVLSAVAVGHPVTIFTYQPDELKRAGLPVNIEHAGDIVAPGTLPQLVESRANSFANIFRLEAIRAGRGAWFDLDIIFVKPLPDRP